MDAFYAQKEQTLLKRDRSSRGRIDPHAVPICALINQRDDFFTLSSCSGRCYLYEGVGNKSANGDTKKGEAAFGRYRVNHELVEDAERYFDLSTSATDRTGGADDIPEVGQYDLFASADDDEDPRMPPDSVACEPGEIDDSATTWLRYEAFILHVQCRTLASADALVAAARSAGFKTTGVQNASGKKIIVFVLGDEGLEMPLTDASGNIMDFDRRWLKKLCNERQLRNWDKIKRFEKTVEEMPERPGAPRHYDVVGDVAIIHSVDGDEEVIGAEILSSNSAIKVVAVQTKALEGSERSMPVRIIAGNKSRLRDGSLVTTHQEHTIKCVVDLAGVFFSPRMGPERIRLTNCVARGENVLVLFAGVGMEGLMIAGRREAARVTMVEKNPRAVECQVKGREMLRRNKAVVGGSESAKKVEIIEADAMEALTDLEKDKYHRVICPRPKMAGEDGDLGVGSGGMDFLKALLPVLRDGGEVHWYDFAADWELESGLQRTKEAIQGVCGDVEWLWHGKAGSATIAKRQYRVCIDFRVRRKQACAL